MYGNAPYAGHEGESPSSEAVDRLRRETEGVAALTRDLLPDEFVVGADLRDGVEGPQGTVAVRPPVGELVRAGVSADATDEERTGLAHELAAGAAVQVKQAVNDVSPTAG